MSALSFDTQVRLHVYRQFVDTGHPPTPLETARELARVFYSRKLDPDWQRAPVGEIEATFARIGLTGDFWSLSS